MAVPVPMASFSDTTWNSGESSATSSTARPMMNMFSSHHRYFSDYHSQSSRVISTCNSNIVSTRDRPYECKQCHHRATTKDSLLRHIRKHTGERPYKCSFCDYAAIQNSDVIKHVRRKHKEFLST